MLVAPRAMAGLAWAKSGRSGTVANCVEAALFQGGVDVRNSRDPDAGALLVTTAAFPAFVGGAQDGDLDHLTEWEPAPCRQGRRSEK
jgi:Domain of unknown function (DUF397)